MSTLSSSFSFTSFKCCDVCFTQHISNVPHIKIVCSQCDNVIKVTKLNNNTTINIHCEHCINTTTSTTTTSTTNAQNTLVNNNNDSEEQQQQTLRETHGCAVENDKKRGLDGLSSSDINNNKGNNNDDNNKEQPSQKTRKTSLDNNNNNNIEHSHENRVIPRDANNIISQLLYSASLFDKLDPKSILNLSLTSSTISKVIRPFINENLFFKPTYRRNFQIYNPQKVVFKSTRKSYPPYIKHIRFDNEFDQYIKNNLPTTLTHLTFQQNFNKPVDNNLPTTLTYLKLGYSFDKPVNNLPASLTHLEFDCVGTFNQSIDHLPPNLKKLSLGRSFFKSVDNLPTTLTDLQFGSSFDLPINHLPHNLTSLIFESYSEFNQPINHLPPNLKILVLGYSYNQKVDNLPYNLTHLAFNNDFNQSVDNLPPNITHLKFKCIYDRIQPISKLPPNLTHLKFPPPFSQKISLQILPKTLVYLSLNQNTLANDDDVFAALPNLKCLRFFALYLDRVNGDNIHNYNFLLPPIEFHVTLGWICNYIESVPITTFKKGGYDYDDSDNEDGS